MATKVLPSKSSQSSLGSSTDRVLGVSSAQRPTRPISKNRSKPSTPESFSTKPSPSLHHALLPSASQASVGDASLRSTEEFSSQQQTQHQQHVHQQQRQQTQTFAAHQQSSYPPSSSSSSSAAAVRGYRDRERDREREKESEIRPVRNYEDNRLEVGLENLGNTCFMNSALQCLVHIQPLVQYFLDGRMDRDLNPASPKKGLLAKSFHGLIHELMSGRAGSSVAPINFQRAVAVFAPYLMDYQQQDSQEFLRFLLDGMSDDLCRRHVANVASTPAAHAITPDTLTHAKARLHSPSAILPALPQIASPGSTASKERPRSQRSLTLTPQHSALSHQSARPLKSDLCEREKDEEYALSDEELSETDHQPQCEKKNASKTNLASIPTTTAVAGTAEALPHSKLRVIKTVAKAREMEHESMEPSSADPSVAQTQLIQAQPQQPPPQQPSQHQPTPQKNTMASTLSNTLRRIRGRSMSESEENHHKPAVPTSTSASAAGADEENDTQHTATEHEAIASSSATDAETVEREALLAWERYLKLNDSIITDIFGGLLQSTTQCCECGHRSFAFDPFLDLSVPISKEGEGSTSRGLFPSLSLRPSAFLEKSTLEKCLEKFTAEEALDGENLYHCEHCKKKRKCLKKLSVFRFPRVLVVHIKRFRFSTTSREKLSTDVHFPLSGLDLRPYLSPDLTFLYQKYQLTRTPSNNKNSKNNNHDEDEPVNETVTQESSQITPTPLSPSPPKTQRKLLPDGSVKAPRPVVLSSSSEALKKMIHCQWEPIYDLIGVSNHHGSLNGGHYIAHVDTNNGLKSAEKIPRWMCFNDARVSNSNASSIAGPTAYVLFYRLREDNSLSNTNNTTDER